MLAKIDTQRMDLAPQRTSTQSPPPSKSSQLAIGNLLRDSLPYFYLTAGFAAFFATLYISDWFWVLPHALLALGGVLHVVYIMIYRGSTSERPGISDKPDF